MALTTGVVLARVGSTYRVHADRGEVTAVLRGRLKRRDDDRGVAGGVVELELQPDGPATISAGRPPPARAPPPAPGGTRPPGAPPPPHPGPGAGGAAAARPSPP